MRQNLLTEIIQYLKSPIYRAKIEPKPFFRSIFEILRINLLAVLVSFLTGLIIIYISTKTSVLDQHAVGEFIQNESLIATFIFACIVAPLLEETAFRLWLINKPFQVTAGLTAFLFYYISSFVPGKIFESIFSKVPSDNPLIALGIFAGGLIFTTSVLYIIVKKDYIQSLLNNIYANHYEYLFYGSAFLFGLLHITNYQISWLVILLAPVIVLPQISGGIFLSYIRVTYGFWRGVFGHFLYNLLLLTPSLGIKLMSESGQKLLSTKDFSIDVLSGSDKKVILFISVYFLLLVLFVVISNVHLITVYLLDNKKKQSKLAKS